MLKKFKPHFFKKTVFDVTPDFLIQHGIKGIITDLDNTLVEWDRPDATKEISEWFYEMQTHGIQIAIVSNNSEERVSKFARPHNILFFYRSRKPLTTKFRQAARQFQLDQTELCVIGDQLLTDIFGGNCFGARTVLVQPVSSTDGVWTSINRKIEKLIFYFLRKHGSLIWEEK